MLQGIYATGGPLLVYVVGREGWTKGQLRATLSTVWLLLNTLLVASFWFEGRYEPAVLLQVAALIPTLPLGLLIGEAIHARVDERRFRFALYGLLVVAALSLLAKSLWGGA